MRRIAIALLGASIATASGLWLACGVPDEGTGPAASPGADGGGDASAKIGNDAATAQDATAQDASAQDASVQDASDAGPLPPEAGGGDGGIDPPDAGPGGTTTIITCGSTTCAIPAQSCCVDRLGGGATAFGCAATCPGIDAGVETAALECSGQSNCAAGTVCCVQQAGSNGASSACKTTCGPNEAQLCSLTAVPSGCVGTMCSNANIGDWRLPNTYATCGGKGN